MLPPPISLPFSTRSYACAQHLARADLPAGPCRSRCGDVNGWCIATQRCSSAFHSSSGKSVTHVNAKSSVLSQPCALGDVQAQLPEHLRRGVGRAARHQQQVGRRRRRPASSAARDGRLARRLERRTLHGVAAPARPHQAAGALRPSPPRRASSSCLREKPPPPGTTNPRTTPPPATASRNTPNVDAANTRRQVARSPCRRAGRACRTRTSRSRRRRTCAANGIVIVAADDARTPRGSAARSMANTSSRVANDISTSICVNSGWRSARRSSSRKHCTIWK